MIALSHRRIDTPILRDTPCKETAMNVLVTGGAGFSGSFLAEQLLARGYTVNLFDNLDQQVHPDGAPAYLPPRAKLYRGDIRNRTELAPFVDAADVIVHCAAAVGVAQSMYQPNHYIDVNVRGTALLLELIAERQRPLHKLIIPTSMTSYGEGGYRRLSDGKSIRVDVRTSEDIQRYGWEPVCQDTGEPLESIATAETSEPLARNVYALSKRYQEELALSLGSAYGFPVVCLRLFNVYGPRQSMSNPYTGVLAIFLSRLLAGQPPVVYEDGRQTRDFISVHDVVDAILLAVESSDVNGNIVNIGSGIARPIGDCAHTLADLLGRSHIEPDISMQFRKGDIRHCTADIGKAGRLMGFVPNVKWEDGLAELIAWATDAPFVDRFSQATDELRRHGLVENVIPNIKSPIQRHTSPLSPSDPPQ